MNDRAVYHGIFVAGILAGALLTTTAGQAADPEAAKPDAANDVALNVPPGFEATLFADDDLAHNIYSMTVDAQGRVVVSGPGYVKILLDTNGDGKADTARQFAAGPKSGAQGMHFHGNDLICTGDGGLLRFRDRDGDGKADGKPDVFLRIKTGAEHHAHAVRQGPDGWWYVVAGNFAGVTEKYVTLPTSPVRKPEGGTILRLKPGLNGGEIFADGFRNAYDFDFNSRGDVFTFDSDGERAVSLPWYLPTRVFHALCGSHAGWQSRSWKRPDGYFEMPPVLDSFGRGSPTGVACYRHTQFPPKYRDAVFILDWTFGRVIALPMEPSAATWKSEPVPFLTGKGDFGFAPTDVAVGPDGSLYVCVGGRGTRGGVYRVTYVGDGTTPPHAAAAPKPESIDDDVWRSLSAPQPLSSWSRAKWEPLARKAGAAAFRASALQESLPADLRVRAIEILTELFGGLTPADLKSLADSKSSDVRARAVWSHGRTHAAAPSPRLVLPFLGDDSPPVRRAAVESLLGIVARSDVAPLLPALAGRLADEDRFVRQAATHLVSRLQPNDRKRLQTLAAAEGSRATVAFEFGRVERTQAFDKQAFAVGVAELGKRHPAQDVRDLVRLLQVSLGDVGPKPADRAAKIPVVYDGYDGRVDLQKHERELDPLRAWLTKAYPSGNAAVDYELARVVSMLSPYNPELLNAVLGKIDEKSDPVADVHHLIVASRIPVERTTEQRRRIAQAFVRLDEKIRSRKLKQDVHWELRVGEMYQTHARIDPGLPETIVQQPEFGRPGHIHFLSELDESKWQPAIDAVAKKARNADGTPADVDWTTDLVFLLGESQRDEHRDLVRSQYSNFGVRDAVLFVLAETPNVVDRPKFVGGLESGQVEVMAACAGALEKFPPAKDPAEQIALFKAARRLGRDKNEIPLRDRLVKLLRRATGREFGYRFQADFKDSQSVVFAKWEKWIAATHPADAAALTGGGESREQFQATLAKVDWSAGDVSRGRELFRQRSCVQCHGGSRALGPDLAGVAKRFSRDDFFLAVVQPDRDVSPRYQTTQVVTTRGKSYVGLVIYDSVDVVNLRTAQNQTIRIDGAEIEIRRRSNTSLMPAGLLKGLKPEDLADLYAYVRSLTQ